VETPKRFEEREVYRRFRYRMIRKAGSRCELCGNKKPLKLVYIKDRAIFSELALASENVKIICQKCLSDAWPGSSLGGFKSFYERPEWKRTRQRVISNHCVTCSHCNRVPDNPSEVHIDHIRPRYVFPEMAFTLGNLQPLCADCNLGKGAEVFENTLASSLVDQHLVRIQARAKVLECRYLNGIRHHISNGPEIDKLIRYIDFRHAVKDAYAHPSRLRGVLASVDRDLKVLETRVGETFDLFTSAM
jgi:5-methylcytosine-specific restriction endonuclease McrA